MNTKEANILLVEDDPGDVELTREGFKESRILTELHVVENGLAAMKYLRREAPFEDAVRPDLILLDLNLPVQDGRKTLEEIKKDPRFRSIPVVILTTSESEADIARCYELGANCYISKPIGFEDFVKAIASIEGFWFSVVKLPPVV